MTRDEILDVLRLQSGVLRARFRVKSIGLFGSYASGHQRSHSDIDLLVEFDETVGLFEFARLEQFLSDLLEHRVDLVMKSALTPGIGQRILEEVAYP